MSLRTVLKKELLWSRHRIVALLFVLVLLPGAFAGSSVFFQSVLPRDAPVAVVGSDDVTEDDRAVLEASLDLFSKPRAYDSREAAFRALERESVYAVVDIPPGIADPDVERVNVTVTIDGDTVPYREPSGALVTVVSRSLNANLEKRVHVQREVRGAERKLSSYLVPTFLLMLVSTLALAYLPYNLAREEAVVDRLRVETSLSTVLVGKLLFFAGLLAVPILVFAAAAAGLGYDLNVFAPGALFAYLVTFLTLGAVATSVTFASRFSTTGRLANVLVLFFVFGFSGLVYPAGFFSPIRREVIRRVPTHYAAVLARRTTFEAVPTAAFVEWIAGLAVVCLLSFVPMVVAVRYYERRA
ncbi:ABC transporter permease [Salinirubellus salinus]|uniref:ABC transporter permease n=1 Tax=Salinirubellus salinus TaxID=1364945 RepID=A0A9E7R4L8_9EURY|nr:ABC transporter permease [Salinirubellus salinus]UWM55775.1 ABC transporter permease [Salinirubellus salinus]